MIPMYIEELHILVFEIVLVSQFSPQICEIGVVI